MNGISYIKKLTALIFCFSLIMACAPTQKDTVKQDPSSGIVPKPESSDGRPGEKLNMMIMMTVDDASDDMDEVIVIPPKDKKKEEVQTD